MNANHNTLWGVMGDPESLLSTTFDVVSGKGTFQTQSRAGLTTGSNHAERLPII